MFRPTADRLRRPSAKLRGSDGHESLPKRVLCASWETSAPTTTLTALLGIPCATRDPMRGRYWDRTSDLCRVKEDPPVSGCRREPLHHNGYRRESLAGLGVASFRVSHGVQVLSHLVTVGWCQIRVRFDSERAWVPRSGDRPTGGRCLCWRSTAHIAGYALAGGLFDGSEHALEVRP